MIALTEGIARSCVLLFALLLSQNTPLSGDEVEPLYGRVSAIEGNLMVKGAREDQWSYSDVNGIVGDDDALLTDGESLAEIEMPGQVFLRLGKATGLDVVSVREGQYRLWKGKAYVSVSDGDERIVAVETPVCAVVLVGKGLVRIEVQDEGAVRVYSFKGCIEVIGAGESSLSLGSNLKLDVDSEGCFVGLEAVAGPMTDELARWHRTREACLVARALPDFIPPETVGARDLVGCGQWVVEDEVRYWRPEVDVSWRPYYAGVWRYAGAVGWCWVPRYSFEYATCHYGTWRYSFRYGWLWRPRWRWRPAHVAWVVLDDCIFWTPLDWHCRPVVACEAPHFSCRLSIGDHFTLHYGSWCYAPVRYFCSERPCYRIVNHQTIIKDSTINIHNIRKAVIARNIDHIEHIRPKRLARGAKRLSHKADVLLRDALGKKPKKVRFANDAGVGRGRLTERLERIKEQISHGQDTAHSQVKAAPATATRERLARRVREFRERALQHQGGQGDNGWRTGGRATGERAALVDRIREGGRARGGGPAASSAEEPKVKGIGDRLRARLRELKSLRNKESVTEGDGTPRRRLRRAEVSGERQVTLRGSQVGTYQLRLGSWRSPAQEDSRSALRRHAVVDSQVGTLRAGLRPGPRRSGELRGSVARQKQSQTAEAHAEGRRGRLSRWAKGLRAR